MSKHLSAFMRGPIMNVLKQDLDKDLNKVINELEVDKRYTKKWLKITYNLDSKQAEEIFQFIIKELDAHKGLVRKLGVPRKPNIFIPTTSTSQYTYLSTWKREMGKKLNKQFGNFSDFSDFGQKFHLGHGASSFAKVEYRILKAGKMLQDFMKDNELNSPAGQAALGFINQTLAIKKATVQDDAHKVFNEDLSMLSTYEVRLKLESSKENIDASSLEKKAKNLVEGKIAELAMKAALEGTSSPSTNDLISSQLDKKLKGKKVTRHKSKYKGKEHTLLPKVKPKQAKRPVIPRPRNAKGQFTSPIALMNLINARLHDMIRKNMGSPALNYQTGRFARSVKITNISQTRQQQMTAFYTYMKSPYQTFERGYEQGSPQRDPRTLISKSIRDAAAQIMGTKFDIRTRRQ